MILGIDHGTKRLGVAISYNGILAAPLTTLDASRLKPLLHQLAQIISQHQIHTIILGLPLNADGTEGPQAQKVRKFARYLNPSPLFQDEHLTTQEAHNHGATKDTKDAFAAALILQAYLDKTRSLPPS